MYDFSYKNINKIKKDPKDYYLDGLMAYQIVSV